MGKVKRLWTDEEIEYLASNWGVKSINAMAKTLGRTVKAVKEKGHKLKLGPITESSEYLTSNQLAKIIGVDSKTIIRAIKSGKLKGSYRKLGEKKKYYRISINSFWKYAKQSPNTIRWDEFEVNSLGKEPKWVSKYRKMKMPIRRYRIWTSEEENLLKLYRKNNIKIKEIANLLNRSEVAVESKVQEICEKKVIAINWKEEEDKILIKLKEKGYSDSAIAKQLGRSTGSIENRRRRLTKKGLINWTYKYKKVAHAGKQNEQP